MNFKNKQHNEKGFTLIELLIVIIVVGALSSVLVSLIDPRGSQGRARDGVRLSKINSLAEGIEAYRQVEGSYPLNDDPTDPESTLRTTYIKKWPDAINDEGNIDEDNWSYAYAQAGRGFVLYSPNSRGGCYKYQTDWARQLECPVAECNTDLSAEVNCN